MSEIDIGEVTRAVAYIHEIRNDDEAAHIEEDKLYLKVLKHHAARGCLLSQLALVTQDIKFCRWHA